jgi:hypothetical protein
MKLTTLLGGAALAAICSGSVASAAVLYDNGPMNLSDSALTINGGQAIGDSFTLTSAATVTGVNFGVYALTGDRMLTVDWGITSDATAVPDNGTAAVTTGAVTDDGGGIDASTDSFSTGPVHLAAGTYYLWLQNAFTDSGDPLFWNINDGPSAANWALFGVNQGSLAGLVEPGSNSSAFQIVGTLGDLPEPATWAMMLAGFGGIGAVMRRGRKARGAALAA